MTEHITNLQIESFRGIRNLNIENLGSVNIFVGDNNTGKTSVMEAIQFLCNPSQYNLIRIARQREKYKSSIRMGLNILESVVYLFDVKTCNKNNYSIYIGGTVDNQTANISVTGEIVNQLLDLNELSKHNYLARNKLAHPIVEPQEETPTFIGEIKNGFLFDSQLRLFQNWDNDIEINEYTRFTSSNREKPLLNLKNIQTVDHVIENAFDKLIKNKNIKEKAVELLKVFDESITDIRYITNDNKFVPVIDNDDNYMPLSLYGDGIKKVLIMLNAVVGAENGVVLIDEFETALHTSAMKKVFRFILDISNELNVQLFLTTHSIEAVDKMLECAGTDLEEMRVIRLKKKDGSTLSKVMNGKEAMEDRKEYNMELRI